MQYLFIRLTDTAIKHRKILDKEHIAQKKIQKYGKSNIDVLIPHRGALQTELHRGFQHREVSDIAQKGVPPGIKLNTAVPGYDYHFKRKVLVC